MMESLQNETKTTIYANPSGWWKAELLLQFLQLFCERSSADEPVMLMWDDFSAHELVAFALEKNVVLQRIPPGYTHYCQPVDIAWNKILKDRIRASWTSYLKEQCSKVMVDCADGNSKLTPPDRKRVLQWLHADWNELSVTTIKD
ncbi:DDE superfamily endonuclease [Phytophthora infestans]|uniref:DDE superfamily endonuclease n=1 Tax=Phytophthora infestans TaxID=4787 RepID=A0A8S9TSR0_PHYIN|nr:DDE superfamily endonuclease [Phytophthora infestans]